MQYSKCLHLLVIYCTEMKESRTENKKTFQHCKQPAGSAFSRPVV